MNRFIFIAMISAVIGVGCSSSDSNDGAGDGSGSNSGNGSSDMTLSGIATADASSEPMQLDITALQMSLDIVLDSEPVPVEDGDTVNTLLNKAGL